MALINESFDNYIERMVDRIEELERRVRRLEEDAKLSRYGEHD